MLCLETFGTLAPPAGLEALEASFSFFSLFALVMAA